MSVDQDEGHAQGRAHERGGPGGGQRPRPRRVLFAILAICLAPVLAAYFTYYFVRPDGRVNYGTLLEPLRDVSHLSGSALDGSPVSLADFKGRWVLLTGAAGACDAQCEHRLYLIRQLRLTTGKDRERVERAWLVPAGFQPDPALLREHEGLAVVRLHAAGGFDGLGLPSGDGSRASEHIWVVDPLGNLVFRYPPSPDPSRIKKDLLRLLKASRIG